MLQQVVPRRAPGRRVGGFCAGAAALLPLPTLGTAPPAVGASTLFSGLMLRDRSTGLGIAPDYQLTGHIVYAGYATGELRRLRYGPR